MQAKAWDWSRTVVDHLDLHASNFSESVRFYEAVLAPLGIPKLFERNGEADTPSRPSTATSAIPAAGARLPS